MKLIILLITLTLSLSALAADKKQQEMYSYATYFACDVDKEQQIDDLISTNYGPIYDAEVKNGTMYNWGWLAHHTGGNWRRILYHTAPTIDALFTAQDKINAKYEKMFGNDPDALAKGCKTHDDYIWQYIIGSQMDAKNNQRGKTSMSVYWECSFNGEERADEIVKQHFAPIYNAHLGKGKLSSWGWLSHVIGGKYRRLETITADNYSDLLKAKKSILDAIYGHKDKTHGDEFTEICTSHTDYLWDIQKESP